ncbi:unnamed protein product [Lathyrus oleraceus]
MTSKSYQSSYILVILCMSFIMISEIVTSLKTPRLVEKPICIRGSDVDPRFCCIGSCSPNCSTDCINKGYVKGGQCNSKLGNKCCCFV